MCAACRAEQSIELADEAVGLGGGGAEALPRRVSAVLVQGLVAVRVHAHLIRFGFTLGQASVQLLS